MDCLSRDPADPRQPAGSGVLREQRFGRFPKNARDRRIV